MCCGQIHSLLLTESSKVYEYIFYYWTQRQNIKFEMKIFANEKIVMISCGLSHSLALTENGRVFGWGQNEFGQLATILKLKLMKIYNQLYFYKF
jgi:alpha-tubulin suppressor-like RCC1 family protein